MTRRDVLVFAVVQLSQKDSLSGDCYRYSIELALICATRFRNKFGMTKIGD